MWAGGSLEFAGILRVDQPLVQDSVVSQVIEKQARSGPMVLVSVDHTLNTVLYNKTTFYNLVRKWCVNVLVRSKLFLTIVIRISLSGSYFLISLRAGLTLDLRQCLPTYLV